MYKVCTKCKQTKCIDSFFWAIKNKGDSRQYLSSWCSSCKKESNNKYQKNKYSLNKEQILALNKEVRLKNKLIWIEKLGGKCFDCGGVFHSCMYDFHHVDPTEKEYAPASLLDRSPEILEKELSKCVLLCSNCHRFRHWGNGQET